MKIIIFGAGMAAPHCAQYARYLGHEILCFVDNDPNKQGKTITLEAAGGGGRNVYEIKPPSALLEMSFDRVMLSLYFASWCEKVCQQLTNDFAIPAHKIDTSFVTFRHASRYIFLTKVAKMLRNLQGNVAELGVFRGEFARHINAHFPTKKLYLFDTFEGFTESDLQHEKQHVQNMGVGHLGDTHVELVLSQMPHVAQCVVRKGWFPDTARGLENECFCFVSLDTDLHDSTLAGLEFFYPRLVSGGVILIDDYDSGFDGVSRAVDAFCAREKIACMPIGDIFSVALQKGAR